VQLYRDVVDQSTCNRRCQTRVPNRAALFRHGDPHVPLPDILQLRISRDAEQVTVRLPFAHVEVVRVSVRGPRNGQVDPELPTQVADHLIRITSGWIVGLYP